MRPLKGGGWELAVHIADVSHYVRPGTELDREATVRGNSTYLVDRVIPMLPERLSNGICSLKPGVDRLTKLAVIEFNPHAEPVKARFAAAVIRSAARFSYEEAFAIMMREGAPDGAVEQMLRDAWDLASKLRRNRFAQGALDLDFAEIKVVLDARGKPTELRPVPYDESHQLIEEFMLAANEAVAAATKRADMPAIYRVHEDPDAEKLAEFRALAHQYGFKVGDLSNRDEIQRLLKMVRGTPEEHVIKIGLLKSLKRAAYHPDPTGHYGLAKANYTHFTSPIRRYADLVVHRVLGNLMAKRGNPGFETAPTPKYAKMGEIAAHISDTERISAEAENQSKQMKILEFFAGLLREPKPPKFLAVVTDIRRIGIFIELADTQVRGLIRADELPPGRYRHDPARNALVGPRQKDIIHVGSEIGVRPAKVDFVNQRIDFRLA
ncbi:MAG: RNB domain-containing ribonuclease [Verrucomicrobiales bacterium]